MSRMQSTAECSVCGLRIRETTTGWWHMESVKGRNADAEHVAQPAKRHEEGSKG